MTAKQITRSAATVRQVNRRATRPAAVTAPSKLFALVAGMRPVSGSRLYAHTTAALEVLGITCSNAASAQRLRALIGIRAFLYHSKVSNSFKVSGELVKLTATGDELFQSREESGKAPRDLIDAFVSVFRTGKPSATASVKAHHINMDPI